MKGIAHFFSGVAAATFLPPVVQMSAQGSMILLLAGIGGLMPDTLDFKLARYLEENQVEIDPDPLAPDPQGMAEQVAAAINRAWETGKPVRVQFHTMKLGADLWRQYAVDFGGERREVRVRIGPVVTTSQVPFVGSELGLPPGCAPIQAPTRYTYGAETKVDIFSGPTFEFERRGDVVDISFLPWHRRWSHALTVAVLIGGLIALLFGLWYGLAYTLGSAAHILEDQLGHMGSNLFYPFTKRRAEGLKLFHSGDALPNLLAVWLSGWLILFNLDRFSDTPVFNLFSFFLFGLALPWALILGTTWWFSRRPRPAFSPGDRLITEMQAESTQVEE